MVYKALTIAGSDNSGGAGIQADLKVFSAFNVYGMSAITSLTAQNTTGVKEIFPVPPDFVYKQIQTITEDIGINAAKTGMLLTKDIVQAVIDGVRDFSIKNLIVDTVMKSKNGKDLLEEDAIPLFIEKLIPLSLIVTPNIPEAEIISGLKIGSVSDMKKAAEKIYKLGVKIVIIKGGHLPKQDRTVDVIYNGMSFLELAYPYVKTGNTHGTGCTFSAAITANIAKGIDPLKSIRLAKAYLHGAIENAFDIGRGHGPLNHNWVR